MKVLTKEIFNRSSLAKNKKRSEIAALLFDLLNLKISYFLKTLTARSG